MADDSAAIDALLRVSGVRPNYGASNSEIDTIEESVQLTLPSAVRTLFLRCNGAELAPQLSLLSLGDAASFVDSINGGSAANSAFGYFPLTDNNDSNYICVLCKPPLAGFVVHVFHDNEPRLLFRNLGEFLAAFAAHLARRDRFLEGMPHSFRSSERTPEDRRLGRELLTLAPELAQIEAANSTPFHFAVSLLSTEDVAEIAKLLEHDNEYIRDSAATRLRELGTPAATEALGRYAREQREFAGAVVKALNATGIDAALKQERGSAAVQVNPGPIWLNMQAFYRHRRTPDGLNAVVQRVRELIEVRRR